MPLSDQLQKWRDKEDMEGRSRRASEKKKNTTSHHITSVQRHRPPRSELMKNEQKE